MAIRYEDHTTNRGRSILHVSGEPDKVVQVAKKMAHVLNATSNGKTTTIYFDTILNSPQATFSALKRRVEALK